MAKTTIVNDFCRWWFNGGDYEIVTYPPHYAGAVISADGIVRRGETHMFQSSPKWTPTDGNWVLRQKNGYLFRPTICRFRTEGAGNTVKLSKTAKSSK